MRRATNLDPRVVEEGRIHSRQLRSQVFHDLAHAIAKRVSRAFRALSRALDSRKGRPSPFARSVRVGWL
jgi:hypothetical protein